MNRTLTRGGLAVAISLFGVGLWATPGCSTSSSSPGAEDIGQTASSTVVATQGGSVTTASGTATVTIPAGALVEDTTITITGEAPSGEAQSPIYDFGPDGLIFAQPVTVSINYGDQPGSGKSAVLAWLNGSTWEQVPGSVATAGVVSGAVSHFSKFTVIIVGDDIVVQSSCGDTAAEFRACGGSEIGTWRFTDLCFKDTSFDVGDDIAASCAEAKGTLEVTADGTVTFDGANLTTNYSNMRITVHGLVPMSCLEGEPCAEASTVLGEDWSCASSGGLCHCTFVYDIDSSPEPLPYTKDTTGNSLLVEDGTEGLAIPYCVNGDVMVVEQEMSKYDSAFDGWPKLYWVLRKD